MVLEEMEILQRAEEFQNRKWSGLTTSDRVSASREAKELILSINEIYKQSREQELMDIMKRLTEIKKKIEKRLKPPLRV